MLSILRFVKKSYTSIFFLLVFCSVTLGAYIFLTETVSVIPILYSEMLNNIYLPRIILDGIIKSLLLVTFITINQYILQFLLSHYHFKITPRSFLEYQSETFICYEESYDDEGFKLGLKRLAGFVTYSFSALFIYLYFPQHVFFNYLNFIPLSLGILFLILGLLNFLSAFTSIKKIYSYYPQSAEFISIAIKSIHLTEEQVVPIIKLIDDLPKDCPDLPIAHLLRQNLIDPSVSLPFSSFSFGAPPGQDRLSYMDRINAYHNSKIRVG